MGISINGPSGIDTAYIIDSLLALETAKVDKVKVKKDDYQLKIDAYTKILSFIKDIGTNAGKLKSLDDFNVFKTASSNEDIVTFSAGVGGVAGTYDVSVFQTAQREKLISTDKLVSSQTAKLSDVGITPGKFSINNVEIIVGANDTIQDVRSKINNATDATGNKTGVTATVLKISETNYRLVITANDTGSVGASYKDLEGGTVLQSLGYIIDADGNKGIDAQSLQSADDIGAAFAGLAAGEIIQYSGVDHDGNIVSNSFVKTAVSTIEEFLQQVGDTFHGAVDVTCNGDGTLSIVDKIGGRSSLSISGFTMGGSGYAFNTATVGNSPMNVLSTGKDAYFSVDGIYMQSTKNTAGGFISGVTLELHKASADEVATITMDRDDDTIADTVEALLNSFNALVRFVKDSTIYGDVEAGGKKGVLAGDMTTRTILDQVRAVFLKNFDTTQTSAFDSLAMIGVKTNTGNSEFTMDRTVFKESLNESFEDVTNLFITRGYCDNPNITMGAFSDDTRNGVYSLVDLGDHYEVQSTLPASADVYQSEIRSAGVIAFKTGPTNGLMLTAPEGSGDATFVFSRGLSGQLDLLVKKLTDAHDGTVSMRQESWRKAQGRVDDRVLSMEARIESYRLRLVKEFSNMEQVMSSLQAQSNNMMSQLGMYSQ